MNRNFTINIKFTTTVPNEDLLQNPVVKEKLMKMYALDDMTYGRIEKNGHYISFDIFVEALNKVTINDISSDFIEDNFYSSNGARSGVKSIRLENACAGTLSVTLGG